MDPISRVRLQTEITEVDAVGEGGTVIRDTPLISGQAEPFSTVDVFDSATLLGVVTANGQGRWTLQLSTPLLDGVHDLSAVQVTQYGSANTSNYFVINVLAEANATGPDSHDTGYNLTPHPMDEHQNHGLPYFPANFFTVRPPATGDVDSAATSHDAQPYSRQSFSHSAGGKNFDAVAFHGEHITFNLASVSDRAAAPQLTGIGGFDLGGHHNALQVTLADVLELGKHNLFIDDGKQQLIVKGKEGDAVNVLNSHIAGLNDGDWKLQGTTELGGVLYHVVEHTSANTELLIEAHVRIDMH